MRLPLCCSAQDRNIDTTTLSRRPVFHSTDLVRRACIHLKMLGLPHLSISLLGMASRRPVRCSGRREQSEHLSAAAAQVQTYRVDMLCTKETFDCDQYNDRRGKAYMIAGYGLP